MTTTTWIAIGVGAFVGIVTVSLLACCVVSGRESRREEKEE